MLLIDNSVVKEVLTMNDCINAQDACFRRITTGQAIHRPRIDMYSPTGREDDYYRWGTMEGADAQLGVMAIRVKSDVISWPRDSENRWTEEKYCSEPGTYCGLIWLFSTRNGVPLAIIQDGYLQHFRVGGGAGLGVRYLARTDASIVGIIGSGGMARTYLEAIYNERSVKTVRVYSPNQAHCKQFADDMSSALNLDVHPVSSALEAVKGSDIVATCTDSMDPILFGDWLEPGMHVTNLGPSEFDESVYQRSDIVVRQGVGGLDLPETDRIQRLRGHSPIAYIAGSEEEMKRIPKPLQGPSMFTRDVPTLMDVMANPRAGRSSFEEVTAYINVGNQGLQFASVGEVVYRQAREKGLGRELPTEWFVQDIRD
ncbi:MAG: ornithine cyclodeaminase family protein [Actinomycetota bacterium]|nr:MAG: ornithine cyclodeaminase family protein [Actinomycetota bacterium]